MDYNIKVNEFEGPFDLLIHLINKNELDIYNIPIHQVTEQYMAYLDQMAELDMNVASEFLVMAATLIEIKSKMLLPDNKLERMLLEFDDKDPRADLIFKLVEYKKYKNATDYFKSREFEYGKVFYKPQEDVLIVDDTDEELNLETALLMKALKNVMNRMDIYDKKRKDYFKTVKRDNFTVEEKMEFVSNVLNTQRRVVFSELFTTSTTKEEIITTFLAVLELLKTKKYTLQQDFLFDDIIIKKIEN